MKLAHQLIIVITVCVVATLTVAGALSVDREDQLIERDLKEDLLIMGRSLRPAFVHTWQTEGRAAAIDLFDYTGTRTERFDRIRARWVELDAKPGSPQHLEDLPTVRDALEHNLPASVHSNEDGGRLTLWLPVQGEGLPRGALELRRTLADEHRFLAESARNVGLTTVGAALVLALAVLAAGRWLIGRPVDWLAEHARRIAGGNLVARPVLRQPSDLGRVARALNEMGEELLRAQRRVADEYAARIAALEQLRHSDRLATLGQLGAGIAHELGTPLTVVKGRAKMIANRPGVPELAVEHARIIGEQAQRMAGMVRQLLDFSRHDSGEKLPCDLGALAESTVKLLSPLAVRRQVTLALDARPDTRKALAVETQLSQALINLVVNGLQATPAGGHVTVRVGTEHLTPPPGSGAPEGDFSFLTVEDDGAGIAPDDLAKVFDPFFTTKPVGEGTGLGLSVAYGIAREHGGWIDVSSAPHKGSRFSLHVPAH